MNQLKQQLKSRTISRQAGDWYLSCSYEFNGITTAKKTDVIGVDLGVKTLATLSNGKVFDSVRSYHKFEAKLSRCQYRNRKKIIGSANYKKAQLKIAKLHTKVANIRRNALHKLTTNKCQKPRHCCYRSMTMSAVC
uniref:transposase n=1 Tax=Okeania sp. SIO2F4 TaxID=2607790 RepID=UPI0025DCCBF2|nr:transposase [Okeania sp. SIO2F4]